MVITPMIRLIRTTPAQQSLMFPTPDGMVQAIRLGTFKDVKKGENYVLWTLPSELTSDPVVDEADET